ncbi:MAG: hypothetical protein ACR2HR_02065 [Euzebya sp.]
MKKLPPNASRYTAVFTIFLGLFIIYLGWNGAAGPDAAIDLRAQFPYLISGGMFGLALVGAGMTLVLIFEGRRDTQQLAAQLERLAVAVERLESARAVHDLAQANSREEAITVPPAVQPAVQSAALVPPFEPGR